MASPSALKGIRKIVAVSDSLSNDEPTNYLALLGSRFNVAVVANAHGGWTTRSYFKDKFKEIAFARIPADADLFILLIGSNDLFEDRGGSEASIAQAVQGVQKLAAHVLTSSPSARILLVAPPIVVLKNQPAPDPNAERRIDTHTPGMLARLAVAYRQLASEKHWYFADLQPVLTEDDYLDAAHPNPAGNRKIADALAAALIAQCGR